MFRIKDVDALGKEGNYTFSIQYRDEEGHAHERHPYDFHEDIHREVDVVFIRNDYNDEGKCQIVFLVKMGDEDVHYEPDLIIPIKLMDFIEHMETNSEEDIEITCPDTIDLETFITGFEMKADPEGKHAPEIVLKTSTEFIQVKLPDPE